MNYIIDSDTPGGIRIRNTGEIQPWYCRDTTIVVKSDLINHLSKTKKVRIAITNFQMHKYVIKCVLKCKNISIVAFDVFTSKQSKIWDLMSSNREFIDNKHIEKIYFMYDTDIFVKQFMAFIVNSNIKCLYLNNINLNAQQLSQICEAIPNTKITELGISINFCYSNHSEAIKNLLNSKLTYLYISPSNIKLIHNDVFDMIANCSLTTFEILYPGIKGDGLVNLTNAIKNNKTIKKLFIFYEIMDVQILMRAVIDYTDITHFLSNISNVDDIKYMLKYSKFETISIANGPVYNENDEKEFTMLLSDNFNILSCLHQLPGWENYITRNNKLCWVNMHPYLMDIIIIFYNILPPYIICELFDWIYLDELPGSYFRNIADINHRRKIDLIMNVIKSCRIIKNEPLS